jgi:pilus assembly protein TadC
MDKSKFNTFLYIMAVYIFISYILGPVAFYYLVDKSLLSAGNGFIAGSILSIILWLVVGSKMVR